MRTFLTWVIGGLTVLGMTAIILLAFAPHVLSELGRPFR